MNRTFKFSCVVIPLLLLLGMMAAPAQAVTDEEIQDSIERGIAWLVGQQMGNGSWENQVAQTGFAVVILAERASDLGYASPFDEGYPYRENLRDGLNYLFTRATSHPGGILYGNSYHTGIAMMGVAASGTPNAVVAVGNTAVDGKTYREVLQGNVDFFAATQNPDGGWGYHPDWRSDNSIAGYVVLGLRYAEAFGCTIPGPLKTKLDAWIDYIQDTDGGSGYTQPREWKNVLKTGNLLFEMAFVGDTTQSERVGRALGYIGRHWNVPNWDPGWRIHYQAMYCLMKGFESLGIGTIEVDGQPVSWYYDFAVVIVATQEPGGSWAWDYWGGRLLATEWALLTLAKIAPPPPQIAVPVDIRPRSCPNPINTRARGVIPVAILGTESFDVTRVDPVTVRLEGVSPLQWALEDVATPVEPYIGKEPGDCTTEGPDGYMDLVFHFDNQEVVHAIGHVSRGDVLVLQLTGNLKQEFGETPIVGEDVVVIVQ